MRTFAVAASLLVAACTSSADVSGPMQYHRYGGLAQYELTMQVDDATRVATVVEQQGGDEGDPATVTLTDAQLVDLQAALTDADLPGLRHSYTCQDYPNCVSDGFSDSITATANGSGYVILVDRAIPDDELPARLVAALDALQDTAGLVATGP